MAGSNGKRKSGQAAAKRFSRYQDMRCHCADCDARRAAPRPRDESWARMEREAEARQLARGQAKESQ